MDTNKDNHRISKIGRDSSNTMMMIKSKNNTHKSHSLSYLYNNNSQTSYEDQEDFMVNAFSWPPRSYTCSFCKREFRSAQALGGHMNVHRKDRARLRQSPPSDVIHGLYGNTTFLNLNLNHNPNPNPNFPGSLNIATTNSQPPLSSLLSSPYNSAHNKDISSKKWPSTQVNHHHDMTSNINGSDLKVMKSQKLASCGVREDQVLEGFAKSLKKKKIIETPTTTVRLDLEIGLLRDNKSEVDLDLGLDLELRLGYYN